MADALRQAALESAGYNDRTVVLPSAGPTRPELGARETTGFDRNMLQTMERQLALYVGPIARHLVERAVRSAGSVEILCETLASSIDRPTDRAQFQQACRRHLGAGPAVNSPGAGVPVAELGRGQGGLS